MKCESIKVILPVLLNSFIIIIDRLSIPMNSLCMQNSKVHLVPWDLCYQGKNSKYLYISALGIMPMHDVTKESVILWWKLPLFV